MEIIKLNQAHRDLRPDVSAIFVDGFYEWIKFFSKDKFKLTRAFTHTFNPDVFYIAIENGIVQGFAACTDGSVPSVKLKQHEFRHYLGFVRGTMAYQILRKEFEEKPYPFAIGPHMGAIEFVATGREFRGRGVATKLLNYLHNNTPFRDYVLEVADTNIAAVKLYEKLGYRVFKKVPEKHQRQSGINFYLYMKYTK
ncbi:GNAT family N-acetyltransferase [Paucilactobacillus wasatchensis]|uniref:N-acetyltransferase domain-containing protein n=1 Tax=Paucilactobacillus wasatchensis TaxID=1335616 RepID=A0A0D1A8K8_9LACO|nr:N-acetyltransferase [Paucilactobacillus wasatchensis]KIS04145.1 hypothetical protein WDC_0208 [Paucilactobacillus wasatchensis]